MKIVILKVKCFILHQLMKLKIIKKAWHKSELELAELQSERLHKIFSK